MHDERMPGIIYQVYTFQGRCSGGGRSGLYVTPEVSYDEREGAGGVGQRCQFLVDGMVCVRKRATEFVSVSYVLCEKVEPKNLHPLLSTCTVQEHRSDSNSESFGPEIGVLPLRGT